MEKQSNSRLVCLILQLTGLNKEAWLLSVHEFTSSDRLLFTFKSIRSFADQLIRQTVELPPVQCETVAK